MNDYILVLVRVITIMSLLLLVNLTLSGKRLIGELPVFDFLVIITMGSIVGADIADPSIHHLPTAFAVVVLALFQFLVNKLIIKNRKFARLITFEPTLVMENGKFLNQNMKKIRYSLDEILMMLREKEIFDHEEVQYGIIESNGKLTVLKKADFNPLTPKDMNINVDEKEIPAVIIIEGKLDYASIRRLGLSPQWVMEEVKNMEYQITNIFLATYTKERGIIVSTYNHSNGNINIQH
ncbi:DUF421 domain-containing protein [Alkaliphilus transvaalensis]|uniref:DUF421 domain-containing protein n=1 Tax=Alkaliphilus transvaalensis TaxID=114628 RepID=UPI000478715D|nr:DUF421 domain-containing protein [Alkaliphilus transvaalensis]